MRQRLLAKCFECMGGYKDGMVDCRIPDCALYPNMPYRAGRPVKAIPTSPDPPNQGSTATDTPKLTP